MNLKLKFILLAILILIAAMLATFLIYRLTTTPIADHFEIREKILAEKMERYEEELTKLNGRLDDIEIKYERKRDEVREYTSEKYDEYTKNPDKYIDDFLEFINSQ